MLITHDPALAVRCERQLALADGQLRGDGEIAVPRDVRVNG